MRSYGPRTPADSHASPPADLLALRKTTTAFLAAMFSSTRTMPFGVRYVAREIFRALRARFSQESEENVLRIAGHVVYYRFLQPAILCVVVSLSLCSAPVN